MAAAVVGLAGGPMQLFDLDGRPTARWDIIGGVFTGPEALSPDGRHVVLTTTSPSRDPVTGFSGEMFTNPKYVLDARTGQVESTLARGHPWTAGTTTTTCCGWRTRPSPTPG